MELDKENLFSARNCKEVETGSMGYFSNDLEDLIASIDDEDKMFHSKTICYGCLCDVDCRHTTCFGCDECEDWFEYFYLDEGYIKLEALRGMERVVSKPGIIDTDEYYSYSKNLTEDECRAVYHYLMETSRRVTALPSDSKELIIDFIIESLEEKR